MLAAGRAAFPAVTVDASAFVAWVAERLDGTPSVETLRAIHCEDLYLACACAKGDAAAIDALERLYLSNEDMPRPRSGAADESDLRQALREKLLVPHGTSAPKIADYAGRGDLRSFIRVVAVRTSLNLARTTRREVDLDDAILEERTDVDDAEIAHLKRRYRADFTAAFHAALATLPARDRNVLRQHYVDGLAMDRIGAIYGVHRITVVRWANQARSALAAETRRLLVARLGLGKNELESIMRLIRSEIDVSLRTHLAKE